MAEAKKEMMITVAEGDALASDFLASLKNCFAANDMTEHRTFMADAMEWDWSGGIKGAGTKDEFFAVLGGSWQMVVSQFLPTNSYVVTDGEKGIVICTFDIVLIMDGHGKVPITPASTCKQ
jgi:hypothetical protein